jgi:macrolide-specific efflux system membrane fusion protein
MKKLLGSLAARPWIIMPLVALLALGGWWAWKTTAGDSSSSAAVGNQVVEVTSGPMSQVVTSEGTVAVAQQQDASFSASGTVTAVNVTAGQKVTTGEVLASIDSAELEAAVSSAESDLADAEAKLSNDTSAGASSSQLEVDRTSVTSAEDQLAAAQDNLDGASLVAEFDGTVASVDLTVGQQLASSGTGATSMTGTGTGSGGGASTLGSSSPTAALGGAATDSSTSSTAQIVVVSSSSFEVELSLDATDVKNLAVGDKAEITLVTSSSSSAGGFPGGGGAIPSGGGFPGGGNAGSGTTRSGTSSRQVAGTSAASGAVTEVSSVADASSGVAKYAVTVSFTDTSGSYNAGASVSVAVTYAEVADTLSVPSRAVTTSSGTSTVTVQTDGGTQTRTVQTGVTVDGMTQITSGLSAGESVVITTPTFGGGGGGGQPTGGLPSGVSIPSGGGATGG